MTLELLASAASGATQHAIRWASLGLRPGISLGFFTLRFYSLAYLAGILLGYWHLSKMARAPGSPLAQRHADDLFFYCTLGIILGGGWATRRSTSRACSPISPRASGLSWDLCGCGTEG